MDHELNRLDAEISQLDIEIAQLKLQIKVKEMPTSRLMLLHDVCTQELIERGY